MNDLGSSTILLTISPLLIVILAGTVAAGESRRETAPWTNVVVEGFELMTQPDEARCTPSTSASRSAPGPTAPG
jgi:hypothetical protein